MAARSEHGRHVLASGSGHWILLDEPDLVVDAIRHVATLATNSSESSTVQTA